MSFINKEWSLSELSAWGGAIPSHLMGLLEGLSGPPSPTIMKALRPLFTDEVIMEVFREIKLENAISLHPDFYTMWRAINDSHLTSITYGDEQIRQLVSHWRQVVTLDDRYLWVPDEVPAASSPFAPPITPPVASSPAPAIEPEVVSYRTGGDPRQYKMYDCTTCKKNILGLHHLYAHHIVAHDGKWAWHKLRDLVGDITAKNLVTALQKGLLVPGTSVPEPAAPTKPVERMFVTGVNVDLREWPDGRYAFVTPGLEPTKANATFIIKRTVKRGYTRSGRFIWGATTRRAEFIKPGRIELRKQVGDTKELIGEQMPDESSFRGEHGAVIEEIDKAPYAAMELYGKLIGACAYCGRSLTDPLSRLRGIGPDCWEEKHVPRLARAKVRSYS